MISEMFRSILREYLAKENNTNVRVVQRHIESNISTLTLKISNHLLKVEFFLF